MNINANFNPVGASPMMAMGGLSGRSMMTRTLSFQGGRNNAETTPAFRESLMDIRHTADALFTAMRDAMGFGADPSSPFGTMHAVSGNTEAMSIVASGGRAGAAAGRDFEVEILQLATHQRNEGTASTANTRATDSGFTVGNNQMSVTIGNQRFDFNVRVNANDSVRDVQNRFAEAINARNIGVTAQVTTEGTGNAMTSALAIQSRETGIRQENQPNFTVSGAAATAFGVTQVTQAAQNAEFRVNRGFTGAVQSSRSNTVDLGFGTRAELRTAGTVEVTMARDEVGQINAVRNMVNLFNDLVEVAQDNRSGQNGGRLERELRSMINSNASAFARVGITMNQHGFLDIDEERMRNAAASGDLENFAAPGGARTNAGMFNRMERMADRVGRNASNYVGVQQGNPMNNFDMTNMSANWNNQFNSWMNAGMLFDSMF
ncbi:MAG: hypothetical protein FWC16_07590 [Defluviitaleaceae bacterium]|nr:hypothetical protein [Defluviitaleaceae bacterium]MCL2274777.1 hypothetical protein [Defluviitaleaceae bacterium]